VRLITDILRDIRKGKPVEQATALLADIVRAVDETGMAGSVTIILTVKPAKLGGSEKTLIAEVKAKKPIAEIAPTVFFSDEDGDLHRVDPTQEEMKFEKANGAFAPTSA
jgi:hypothetical protein